MKLTTSSLQLLLLFTILFMNEAMAKNKSRQKNLDFLSPIANGLVVDGLVPIVLKCKTAPVNHNLSMPLLFVATKFKHTWYARFHVSGYKNHILPLDISCGKKRQNHNIRITNIALHDTTPAQRMAHTILKSHEAYKLKWDWSEAIMLFGLLTWAKQAPGDSTAIEQYIEAYQHHHFFNPPKIDWADRCPSGLTALMSWNDRGHSESHHNLMSVLDYIKHTKKNELGSINHFGNDTFMAKIFPASIWVDSLMMYGLLSVKAGIALNDPELLQFGLKQQLIFADKMIDPKTKLYYHAWNVKKDRPYPKNNTFWLRGNGWVGASLVLMLEALKQQADHNPSIASMEENLVTLTRQLAISTKHYLAETKMFETLLADPGDGYEETSGTALLAFLYVKGAKLGVLDESYKHLGYEIYQHLTARLIPKDNGQISMPDISWLTMPYPKIGYRALPRKADLPYGLGAYLLLSSAVSEGQ